MGVCLLRFNEEFKSNKRISDLMGTSSLINVLGGVIVTGLSFSFLMAFFQSVLHVDNVSPYIGVLCLAALAQSLTMHLMCYYRIEDRAVTYMITGLVSATILLIANSVFLYVFELGVMGALWASALTYGGVLFFLSAHIFPITGISISLSLMSRLLRFGFPLIFSDVAYLIMGGSSIYFLSYFYGLDVVATYSLGAKLASVVVMAVILPFQLAFQPYVYSHLKDQTINQNVSRLLTYLVIGVTAMFFVIVGGSRLLLPIIAPPEYSASFLVILFLLPGMTFVGLYYIGETLLGAVNRTHLIGLFITLSAAIAIVLNGSLIPVMNWYGAVIASNISYVFAGLALLYMGKKYFPFSVDRKKILVCLSLFVFLFCTFWFLYHVRLGYFIVFSALAALLSVLIAHECRFFSRGEVKFMRDVLFTSK
jgi:O-antigen/teichoic acid export membrane protein